MPRQSLAFSAAKLLDVLMPCQATRYWVAYSGGCDSHVLLHALASLRPQLSAPINVIHVDHGLNPQSQAWATHCQQTCDALDLPCVVLKVDAFPKKNESPEDAARRARYGAFEQVLAEGDCLCLGHHQDDQAETLLLQLLRGAGPKGLAAMPFDVSLGQGSLRRPLLDFSRQALLDYAQQAGLSWIDDPSNFDTGYDRNYLRQQVIPLLKQRWPAVNKTLSRSAKHCASASGLMDELAQRDWVDVAENKGQTLEIARLLVLSIERQKNLIRYWISQLVLPLPSEIKLQHILNDVIHATEDAMPCVQWRGAQLRRFDSQLYAMSPLAELDTSIYDWDLSQPLCLADGRELLCRPGTGILALDGDKLRHARVSIRFRCGGESMRIAGRAHHHSLKRILQEKRVPPWQRARLPLLFVGDELAAIIGLCVSEQHQARDPASSVVVRFLHQ